MSFSYWKMICFSKEKFKNAYLQSYLTFAVVFIFAYHFPILVQFIAEFMIQIC